MENTKQKKNSIQLKVGIILSYIAITINILIQLLYSPVMIQQLGQSEYGLYTLVASVVNYLSLFSLGFGGAYLRFCTRYESKKDVDGLARLNGMFLTVFMIMAGVAFLVGLVLSGYTDLVFGSNLTVSELEKAEVLMRVLVVNICLTFPESVFNAIITAHEKFIFQKVLQMVSNVCNPLICLPLLFFGCDSVAIVCVTTGITMVRLSIDIFYCISCLKVKFSFHGFECGLLKEIACFSFFLFLNMIIDQINWSVDKFILGRVAGTTEVAVYGVAAMINSIYITFSTAISNVFAPRINRIVEKGGDTYRKDLTDYFVRVGRLQFMVLCLVVSGFIVFGEYFITNIYLTPEYKGAYVTALFLIVPVTIPLIQNIGIEMERAMNKHPFRVIVYTIMAFINVIISIPLAMYFGSAGSAMGTAFGLLIANGLIMNIHYHKVLGIDMVLFWKSILRLAKGLVLPAIVGFVVMYTEFVDSILKFIVGVLVYIVIYAISFWKLGMNAEEKKLVKGIVGCIDRRR